jgi:hypothetical protein
VELASNAASVLPLDSDAHETAELEYVVLITAFFSTPLFMRSTAVPVGAVFASQA